MAFKLVEIADEVVSTSPSGKFKVELSANKGSVQPLSARYGTQHGTANPQEFDVEAGVNDLVIKFQATQSSALVRLHELDGSKKQKLTSRPATDESLSIEIRTEPAAPANALAPAPAKKKAAKKKTAKKKASRKASKKS